MDASETQALIQPYLDGQLEPPLKGVLTAQLAADAALARLLEAERRFHQFLRRILADVPVPAGLHERIHERLVASAPVQRFGSARLRHGWMSAAALVVLGLVGIVAYHTFCPSGRCRYMAAACAEHLGVLDGERPLTVVSSDAGTLTRYVQGRLRHGAAAVPELGAYALAPMGAGTASFGVLRPVGAPEGVFVEYQDSERTPVTLLLHEWPTETPSVPPTEHAGQRFWCVEYGGVSAVCWKSPDHEVLCSLVARKRTPDLLQIALEARTALEKPSAVPVVPDAQSFAR